jgi:hypothetical protein
MYHNDDDDTYILFGSENVTPHVSLSGDPDVYPTQDHDELNMTVGGINMLQMYTSAMSGFMTINKDQHDYIFNVYGGIAIDGESITSQDIVQWNSYQTGLSRYDHIETTMNENSAAWMSNTESSVTDLTTTVSENSAQWASHVDTSAIESDITTLETNFDLLKTDVVSVTGDVETLESNVTNITSDVNTISTNVGNIQNNLNNFDSTLTDVKTVVNSNSATTWSQPGLYERDTASTTAIYVADGAAVDMDISGVAKCYMLLNIQTSHAAWVTLYVDAASRLADASRNQTTDPGAGSGVIAEVITTGAANQLIVPGVCGFNNDNPLSDKVYAKVVNQSGGYADITITLTYVQLEA